MLVTEGQENVAGNPLPGDALHVQWKSGRVSAQGESEEGAITWQRRNSRKSGTVHTKYISCSYYLCKIGVKYFNSELKALVGWNR